MKRRTLSIVLIALVAITSVFVGRTYARYVSSASASGNVSVAKWAMSLNNTNITPDGTTNAGTITLTATSADDVVNGKVAPGVNASGVITLDPEGTEVSFMYSIALGTVVGTLPENLAWTYEYCIGSAATCVATATEGWTALTGNPISGTRLLTDNSGAAWGSEDLVNIRVTASWPWGDTENNVQDTADGVAATGTITVPFDVTVKQYLTGQAN